MGSIAARPARTVVGLAGEVAAIHLLAQCQAADLVGADLLGGPTRRGYDHARDQSPRVSEDRRLAPDTGVLAPARPRHPDVHVQAPPAVQVSGGGFGCRDARLGCGGGPLPSGNE
jgi:hypothetical protein